MKHLRLVPERNPVVAAFEDNDHDGIRKLGWWAAWEAAHTWWAGRQKCTAHDFVPYAKLLHDEDPEHVLDAFRDLAGQWRPSPSAVRAHLRRGNEGTGGAVDVGRSHDRAATEAALAAVAAGYDAGEQPCSCGIRRPTWRIDHAHVLRCIACGGLELGQVYRAEDLGLLTFEEPAGMTQHCPVCGKVAALSGASLICCRRSCPNWGQPIELDDRRRAGRGGSHAGQRATERPAAGPVRRRPPDGGGTAPTPTPKTKEPT